MSGGSNRPSGPRSCVHANVRQRSASIARVAAGGSHPAVRVFAARAQAAFRPAVPALSRRPFRSFCEAPSGRSAPFRSGRFPVGRSALLRQTILAVPLRSSRGAAQGCAPAAFPAGRSGRFAKLLSGRSAPFRSGRFPRDAPRVLRQTIPAVPLRSSRGAARGCAPAAFPQAVPAVLRSSFRAVRSISFRALPGGTLRAFCGRPLWPFRGGPLRTLRRAALRVLSRRPFRRFAKPLSGRSARPGFCGRPCASGRSALAAPSPLLANKTSRRSATSSSVVWQEHAVRRQSCGPCDLPSSHVRSADADRSHPLACASRRYVCAGRGGDDGAPCPLRAPPRAGASAFCALRGRPLSRRPSFLGLRFGFGGQWRVEIGARFAQQGFAELIAQHTATDLFQSAVIQIAELERPERQPDEPVHFKAEMFQYALDLAIFALAQAHGHPGVGALHAIERGFDPGIMNAIERHAVFQRVELRLIRLAVGADTIAAQPACRRQFENARRPPSLVSSSRPSVLISSGDGDEPRRVGVMHGEIIEDRLPAFRIFVRRDEAARLVEHEKPRPLALRQWLAVNFDLIARADVHGRRSQHGSVDGDAAFGDPRLGVAARAKPDARHHLGDALALLFSIGRLRADGRTFRSLGTAMVMGHCV